MHEIQKPTDEDMAVDLKKVSVAIYLATDCEGAAKNVVSACRRALYAEHRCREHQATMEGLAEMISPGFQEGLASIQRSIEKEDNAQTSIPQG